MPHRNGGRPRTFDPPFPAKGRAIIGGDLPVVLHLLRAFCVAAIQCLRYHWYGSRHPLRLYGQPATDALISPQHPAADSENHRRELLMSPMVVTMLRWCH